MIYIKPQKFGHSAGYKHADLILIGNVINMKVIEMNKSSCKGGSHHSWYIQLQYLHLK